MWSWKINLIWMHYYQHHTTLLTERCSYCIAVSTFLCRYRPEVGGTLGEHISQPIATYIMITVHLFLCGFSAWCGFSACAFSALTLSIGHQVEHPVCKKLSDEVLMWLFIWSEVQIVCIWSSWCHCIPKPHRLLPHLNPDCFYLSGTSLPCSSWKRGH